MMQADTLFEIKQSGEFNIYKCGKLQWISWSKKYMIR